MQLLPACDELCFPGQPRVVLPEHEISKSESCVERPWNGGADRDRTCDLLIANETLYQLSYDPIPPRYLPTICCFEQAWIGFVQPKPSAKTAC
jgi:hypothetical protein